MKVKIFTAALILFISVPAVEGKTNGYLSFEYIADLKSLGKESNSFQETQIGLVFSGVFSPSIDYLAELCFRDGLVHADQAWIRFFSTETFKLKMGLYLVPFGKYNQFSRPHETFLIHTPLNIEYSYPFRWRDIGAVAEGRIGSLVYTAYVGNGLAEGASFQNGQQFRDNNTNKGIGGRLGLFLSQSFEVAYSHYRGKFDEEDERNLVLQGVDLTWSTEGVLLLAEYTRGDSENPEGFAKGKVEGFFVQASILLQTIRPVVCFQKVKYTDSFHGQGFILPDMPGEGIDSDLTRWAFGIVYVPIPNVFLKLEYDLNRDRLTDQMESAITFQAALSF